MPWEIFRMSRCSVSVSSPVVESPVTTISNLYHDMPGERRKNQQTCVRLPSDWHEAGGRQTYAAGIKTPMTLRVNKDELSWVAPFERTVPVRIHMMSRTWSWTYSRQILVR